jgi:L-ribulokinase
MTSVGQALPPANPKSHIVAGVDFGTLSVRVSIFDHKRGRLGAATADYPLHRSPSDPDFATQTHADHLRALEIATRAAIQAAGINGQDLEAIALDTTGSSVIPVDADMQPLGDYYLWCDHRAWREAAEITRAAHAAKLEAKIDAIDWCGGTYSSEWGFSKLLHWLRHNPELRPRFASAFEHCDMIAAVLCGVKHPQDAARSVCAMGHKWMWNPRWDGLPSNDFLTSVDPLLSGVRDRLQGRYATSDQLAGHLSAEWAARLGLKSGIPIPVGAFDAHWDAIGAGLGLGDVVNVVGTSTCIIGITPAAQLVPGVCGVVPGSVHPAYTGIEAGLSATGDIFDAIARRAGKPLAELSQGLENYRAGQTGLMRLTWDNGDRTVLVNPELGGVTLGWNLTQTPQDEIFAAIEGTAFHTRVILERMEQYGTPVQRVINGGGIPRRNRVLNQVYADVFNKPLLVPNGDVTSLGAAIFAFLAASVFSSIEDAQDALCPPFVSYAPDPEAVSTYEKLYPLYRTLYFGLGSPDAGPVAVGSVLPTLRSVARGARP